VPEEHETEAFLRNTFRSVWALELLLYLEKTPERSYTPTELVEGLRASHGIVDQGLASLFAAGLIVVEANGSARYAPANARFSELVAGTRVMYASHPGAVRRIIVSGAAGSATAFADAFRLRKD
jgi:hypothetical protein